MDRTNKQSVWSRLRVLTIGVAVGAAFALVVAGPMMPENMALDYRSQIWLWVMGGPYLGLEHGYFRMASGCGQGFLLAVLFIPAHPIHPHWATGVLTTLGLVSWFFLGFLCVMTGVYGK